VKTTVPASTAKRLTARGAKTRAKIVAAAADLIYVRGVGMTTLDDVVTASGVSKSQLYHHFSGKDMLVRAVVELTGERVIQRETESLGRVATIAGLKRWRDALIQNNALRHGAYGCALGSLASDIADHDDEARRALADLFVQWEDLLAAVLQRIKDSGALPPEVPVGPLATGLMGAVQGGYLLAQTAHDVAPMGASITMALDRIESLTAPQD
jgi:AcrR family transcriptional regulator